MKKKLKSHHVILGLVILLVLRLFTFERGFMAEEFLQVPFGQHIKFILVLLGITGILYLMEAKSK